MKKIINILIISIFLGNFNIDAMFKKKKIVPVNDCVIEMSEIRHVSLPDEIILEIFSYLYSKDKRNMPFVCKNFNRLWLFDYFRENRKFKIKIKKNFLDYNNKKFDNMVQFLNRYKENLQKQIDLDQKKKKVKIAIGKAKINKLVGVEDAEFEETFNNIIKKSTEYRNREKRLTTIKTIVIITIITLIAFVLLLVTSGIIGSAAAIKATIEKHCTQNSTLGNAESDAYKQCSDICNIFCPLDYSYKYNLKRICPKFYFDYCNLYNKT